MSGAQFVPELPQLVFQGAGDVECAAIGLALNVQQHRVAACAVTDRKTGSAPL